MKKTILTDKAIRDFQDLEKEINALMSIFLKRPFQMREESIHSKYKKMSYMVYILFASDVNCFEFVCSHNKLNCV